jgi:hypothetical protein
MAAGPGISTIPMTGSDTAHFGNDRDHVLGGNGLEVGGGTRTVLPFLTAMAVPRRNSRNWVERTIV